MWLDLRMPCNDDDDDDHGGGDDSDDDDDGAEMQTVAPGASRLCGCRHKEGSNRNKAIHNGITSA
jgi:hypothetical protein